MSSDYTYKKGLVYKNQYHVIWCPKYRRPVLVGEIETRLKEIFRIYGQEVILCVRSVT